MTKGACCAFLCRLFKSKYLGPERSTPSCRVVELVLMLQMYFDTKVCNFLAELCRNGRLLKMFLRIEALMLNELTAAPSNNINPNAKPLDSQFCTIFKGIKVCFWIAQWLDIFRMFLSLRVNRFCTVSLGELKNAKITAEQEVGKCFEMF